MSVKRGGGVAGTTGKLKLQARRRRRWWRISITVTVMVAAAAAPWMIDAFWHWRYPYRYRPIIERAAAEFQLDPYLVAAVIREESRFNADAVSAVGAIGLMQMMPSTAGWAAKHLGQPAPGSDALLRPDVNIRLGCWYLRYLIRRHQTLEEALAAYNGGEGNVARWRQAGQGIQFHETRQYVARSLRSYDRYRTLYKSPSSDGPLRVLSRQGVAGGR
jgi:soluble lytic murein transglycosylase